MRKNLKSQENNFPDLFRFFVFTQIFSLLTSIAPEIISRLAKIGLFKANFSAIFAGHL